MLLSTPSIELPKKTSRHDVRVRTGCKTCKIRRVKCDEQKPNCSRCTSTGRKCDGYPIKKDTEVQFARYSQTSSLHRVVSSLSELGDSVHYLEFYYHCARQSLSTTFDNEFWSRIVLQMAQSESAVRHALVALSYLHKSEPGNLKYARSEFLTEHSRKTLVSHYNKSIRHLVDRMAQSSYSPEIGLVTCMLFICIEYFRGNHHTAFIHMTNGLKVLSEWELGLQRNSDSLQLAKSIRNDSAGGTSIIPNNIKPLFVRAITSALLYGVEIAQVSVISSSIPHISRKQPFKTLLEAQASSHELRNASIVYIRETFRKLAQKLPMTAEDLQRQRYFLESHDTWYHSLEIFEAGNSLSKEEVVTASALKVSHHATYIYVACATEVLEKQYDTHLERFKALIHHSKLVLASMTLVNSHAAHFTFEMALIPPLYFVACRCRCPVTRREAVSMLRLNLPREGLWDAEQQAVVADRIIEMEESELEAETGWPVERTRLWTCVVNADMDRNGGFWVFYLPARWVGEVDPNGKPKILQEWFIL